MPQNEREMEKMVYKTRHQVINLLTISKWFLVGTS